MWLKQLCCATCQHALHMADFVRQVRGQHSTSTLTHQSQCSVSRWRFLRGGGGGGMPGGGNNRSSITLLGTRRSISSLASSPLSADEVDELVWSQLGWGRDRRGGGGGGEASGSCSGTGCGAELSRRDHDERKRRNGRGSCGAPATATLKTVPSPPLTARLNRGSPCPRDHERGRRDGGTYLRLGSRFSAPLCCNELTSHLSSAEAASS